MAFHHRKLLDEPITWSCQSFCVDPENFNTTCPEYCLKYCPDSCKLSFVQFPPPPPPPPPLSTSNDPGKPPSGGLSLALTASLAVLATAFFIFTCYTIYKIYTVWKHSRRRRDLEEDSVGGDGDDDFLDEDVVDHPIWYIRTVGLQPSVINAITMVKYKSADGLVEGTDCAVCLSEFEEDETLRLLPKCSHAFHIPCIDTWLASHTNCPMCRAGIVTTAAGPFPLQDPIVHNSGRAEEGSEVLGGGNEIEGDGAARSQIGIESGENIEGGECKIDVDGVLQPVRRSVSMDSLSASMISAAVANAFPRQCDKNSGDQLGKVKVGEVGNRSLLRLFESPSIERCVQTGSSSIKRSASCSAKVFLSRHSSRR